MNAHVIILIRDTDYGFIPCFPNFLLGGCVLAKIVQSEFYCFVLCNSCHLLANQYAFLSPVQRQWAASSGLKWRGVTFLKRLQLRKYTAQLARFIQSQFNLGQSRFKLWSNKTEITIASWIGHQRIFGTCHWWHWATSLENWHISWLIRLQRRWLKVSYLFVCFMKITSIMKIDRFSHCWFGTIQISTWKFLLNFPLFT